MRASVPRPTWAKDEKYRQQAETDLRKLADYIDLEKVPVNETPGGTINGINDTFTLETDPLFLMLFLDGLLQVPTTAYTISGKTITMVAPPGGGTVLHAIYWL